MSYKARMDGPGIIDWTGRGPATAHLLGRSFDNVTNVYKHLWLSSLLEHVSRGEDVIPFDDVAIGMVRLAWHPVLLFHLSFGLQDSLAGIVREVAHETGLAPNAGTLELASLSSLRGDGRLRTLTRYVPTRFLTPWLTADGSPAPTDAATPALSRIGWGTGAGCPYRISGHGRHRAVEMDPAWADWLRRNAAVVRDFVRHRLCSHLQARNPSVPGIVLKLEAPVARNLEPARRIWTRHRETLALRGEPLTDIYTDAPLDGTLSIDHYLPWSFVVHDQLWNLVPTTVPLNSAKNDDIPHERFLPRLAAAHHRLIGAIADNPRMLADHAEFLGGSPQGMAGIDAGVLTDMYRARMTPLAAIAGLQGFRSGWSPRA